MKMLIEVWTYAGGPLEMVGNNKHDFSLMKGDSTCV